MKEKVKKEAEQYHPFYRDVWELGFDTYMMQQFVSSEKRLELYLVADKIYKPEYGGYFPSEKEYIRNAISHEVNPSDFTVHLAYIGVSEAERKKGKGTKLLSTICDLADKYDFAIELEVDNKFGVSYESLKNWYETFGFHLSQDFKMLRYRKSERASSLRASVPTIYREEMKRVAEKYKIASEDEGYTRQTQKLLLEVSQRMKENLTKDTLGYVELSVLCNDMKESLYILVDAEESEEFHECLEWLKGVLKHPTIPLLFNNMN